MTATATRADPTAAAGAAASAATIKTGPDDPKSSAGDQTGDSPRYVRVEDFRPDGYEGNCLRPLGLCELGGCCDVCWYRPDHPRFSTKKNPR